MAHTRRQLVSYMKHENGQDRTRAAHGAHGTGPAAGDGTQSEPEGADSAWETVKRTASAWWHSHPARLALEVAEPVLEKYARAHPLKLLAMAAGVGAVLVLAKPWRLVSLTGVAVAALKSSQLSAMVASFMHNKANGPP